MEPKARRVVQVALVLSVVLAVLGQSYFARKRELMWDGITFYVVAALLFSRVIVALEGRPMLARSAFWGEFWGALHNSRVRLGVLVAGALAVLYVALASPGRSYERSFLDLSILWIMGNALVVSAFVDWAGLPRRLREVWARLRRLGPEVALVAAFALATFLFRGINRNGIPAVLDGDEAAMGMEAVKVITGRLGNPFVTGWSANSTFYFFLQAAFLRLLGINTAALRLPSALVSSATVILLYAFAKHFFGRWVAILSSILFCTYHYAIHFGRLAINNIWDPFFALGSLFFFSLGLERKSLGSMLGAAFFVGLSVYFHAGSRLMELILVAYFLYWALSRRDLWRENRAYLVIFAFMALLIALPLLVFFVQHPADMMAPWTRKGIFPTGWVEQQHATGRSVASILLGQFLKSVLAFNYSLDPTPFYRPGIPLLQFIQAVFFVFGLTYAITQWRKRGHFLLLIWILGVVIFGSTLLENPPSAHRLVTAIPPLVLCVTLGIVKVSSYVQRLWGRGQHLALTISLSLVLLTSYQSVHFYFATYTPGSELGGVNTLIADRLGKYLRLLGPGYECYLFGAPQLYFYGHPTIPFLAQGIKGYDVSEPLKDRPSFVDPQLKAVFVFLPDRLREFEVVRRAYPTGLLREFRDRKGQVLFTAYEATD